jgi:hypothetical protein
MCFVSIYENRKVKPVEIVQEGGRRRRGRRMEGVTPTKIHCKHICKYHNVSWVLVAHTYDPSYLGG